MTTDTTNHSTPDDAASFAVTEDGAAHTDSQTPSDAPTEEDLPTRIKPPKEHDQIEHNTGDESISVGSILKGRFIIDSEIARGGMGVVYRARDYLKEQFQDREPYVAIKVLGDECKAHPDFLIALQREAVKAQKLAHPNIVTVYDFDSDGDNVFMTMEYLEGESLQKLLHRRGAIRLPTKHALDLIKAMGQGLTYAHQKGIVHCDFKPGNVFLTRDNNIKILDFGIARADKRPEQQDVTRFDAGTLGALTPTYASCELLENADPDPRDDIYGLACVAYELLTGRHPFNRLPANVARDSKLKPEPIRELNRKQWQALRRGLAFDRTSRPANVTEFLSALTSPNKSSALQTTRKLAVGLAFALVLATVVSAGTYFFSYQTKSDKNSDTVVAQTPTQTEQPVTLSAEQQQKVSRLLEAAEIHFMVKRITEPVGSNAYEAYKHVLEIDPTNKKATAGLKQIADYYENLAQESLPKGDHKATLSIINRGLTVMPTHTGLNKIKQQVDDEPSSMQFIAWFKKLWE
ncbi:MAG: serine/threonine-protein kinase [Gammaproteobacteria bacterium]|jgi:serine/threonine protein kinase